MESRRHDADDVADLYERASCGLLSTTPDGTILRANRTFLEWTGYEADDLLGSTTFSDLLTAGGRIYYETHLRPLLRMQGSTPEIAVDVVAADGRRLPAFVNAAAETDEGGGPETVRLAVFPAPGRREYERELLRARARAEESEARARVLAETLQASLIPPTPPEVPFLDVGAAFRAAGSGAEVGGDFYDVFEIAEGDWAVVIGDVRGKGAQAASVTALARYTVRAAAIQVARPALVLELLNEAMLRQRADTFCTATYAQLARAGADRVRVSIACGGHAPPIHVPVDGAPREVGELGTLIGVLPDPELHDADVFLGAGDVLAFFTDGVTEGRRGAEFFGEDRLTSILADHRGAPAAETAARVVDTVTGFQNGFPRDDIAVVVLKVPAGAAP